MKLAINGGTPVRTKLFPAQNTTGKEEAVCGENIIRDGILSSFRGNSSPSFYGGEWIHHLEYLFKQKYYFSKAITVNSCTSALQIACGAIGLGPGDEVIVTPWSMSCSATAPMIWGATPVFADIEEDYFCLEPSSVIEKITSKTKAIIAVDLFGQPFNPQLKKIAHDRGILLIEDAAQAIGAYYEPTPGAYHYTGSLGDIGCFSFTQGKHLTSGEGGIISIGAFSDKALGRRCQLLRNHAEAVISDGLLGHDDDNNLDLVGYNMRMTELQAAILTEQLYKIDDYIAMRQKNIFEINKLLCDVPGIYPTFIRSNCSHSYYVQSFLYKQDLMKGIHRDKFIAAVKAELSGEEKRLDKGVPIGCGYIKPLYRMPLFLRAQHPAIKGRVYQEGDCPVAEELYKNTLFTMMYHALPLTMEDIQDIGNAFYKVYENLEELR